jgi:hypothetical protein
MKSATAFRMLLCFALLSAGIAGGSLTKGEDERQDRSPKLVKCTMVFNLQSWSAFFKSTKGQGTISCDNGQTANVRLKAKGGGVTFGKSDVINGHGKFSAARNINELFGSYVQSEVHAGAGKSAGAQALTKGEISLALSGTGRGVDLGFAFGKFTIVSAR